MSKVDVEKSVRAFATIGFMLLAILFGMIIMVFVFGSISSDDFLDDGSFTESNETQAFINSSGYTLGQAGRIGFISPAITIAVNNTIANFSSIDAGEYVLSGDGVVTNGTLNFYSNVSFAYTYRASTDVQIQTDRVSNSSLSAIGDYADQSGTQFTTLGVAITLILLVAVFLFFWKAFMGDRNSGGSSAGNFS